MDTSNTGPCIDGSQRSTNESRSTTAVVRGAPITVKCDCGEVRYVAYGQVWDCPACHRRWNTGQIPAEEYWGIMREARRDRLKMMVVAAAFALGFAALALAMGPAAWGLTPVVIGAWFLLLMPRWRRKLRAQARSLPKWQLRPE